MSKGVEFEEKDAEELRKFVSENYHKVRKCNLYEMEYEECKSLKGRFQQHYVYGEKLDCSKWKEDLDACNAHENSRNVDYKLLTSIILHENERLEKRMKAHLENDVWEKRSQPPPHWNSKLPDWLEKRQEHSFIHKPDSEEQMCIIS